MNKRIIQGSFLQQLKEIIEQYNNLKGKAKYDDLSDLGYTVAFNLTVRARAAIERVSGIKSPYTKQVEEILSIENDNEYNKLKMIIGVVEGLAVDLESGYLSSITEIIHGDIFSDFLEMAFYLLDSGFKDAAAVIAGGTLESHLRQLSTKHKIDIEHKSSKGIRPKKADQINSDLAKAEAYTKLEQKNITAWLDIRNKAAHGDYESYEKENVSLMIAGLRDFITRFPA